MSGSSLRHVLDCLRARVGPPGTPGVSDAQLLERWIAERDQAAFELLLRRHGPMVFSVCRRMLGQQQDIEDAFQATFLVLVTKARSIGKRASVGSWLYKIAVRAALRSRTRSARHSCVPLNDRAISAPPQPDEVAWRDLRRVLDEEVDRLPERYRAVFVLCCLEGKTNVEAARECGLPLGTVLSRLSRARERLRVRLSRRGLALSAGLLTAGFAQEAAAVHLPILLVASTMKAIACGAAEPALAAGFLTAQTAALTKGVLHAMWLTKVKLTFATALSVAVIGGGSMVTYRAVAAGFGDTGAQGTQEEQPKSEPEDKLLQMHEKLREALKKVTEEKHVLEMKYADLLQGREQMKWALTKLNDEKLARLLRIAELEGRLEKQTEESQKLRALLEAQNKDLTALRRVVDEISRRPPKVPPAVADREKATEQAKSAEVPGLLPVRPPTPPNVPRPVVETARDEVELLKLQLERKRHTAEATQAALKFRQQQYSRYMELVKANSIDQRLFDEQKEKLGQAKAENDAAVMDMKEAEMRLQQAQRRLGRLQGETAPPAPAQAGLEHRVRDLESQVQGLHRQLDELRRQIQKSK